MLGMLAVLTLLPPTGMLTSGMLSLRLPGGMLTLLYPACLLLLPALSSALPEIIKIGQAVSIDRYLSINNFLHNSNTAWTGTTIRHENVSGLCPHMHWSRPKKGHAI